MSTDTTTRSATAQLEQLRTAATEAAAVATEARAAHTARQIAVATAEKELRAAYAAAPDRKKITAAQETHAAAEAKLSDRAFLAEIAGRADAQRAAEAEAARFVEDNFRALVEEARPDAEAAAASIEDRIADLRAAIAHWHAIDQRITNLSRHVQWFKPQRLMPTPPFTALHAGLAEVDRCGVPVPMPRSLESPAEEQQRLTAAFEAAHPESAYRRVTSLGRHRMGGK